MAGARYPDPHHLHDRHVRVDARTGGRLDAGETVDRGGDAGARAVPQQHAGRLWIFGINKGGAGQDWKELLPVRRLDAASSRGTHRDDFAAEITRAMTDDLGGGTGRRATAFWRRAKQAPGGLRPDVPNSVIVMTDGRNEDANSIGSTNCSPPFEQPADPARPVLVLTIGISGCRRRRAEQDLRGDRRWQLYRETAPISIGVRQRDRGPGEGPQVRLSRWVARPFLWIWLSVVGVRGGMAARHNLLA